MKHGITHQYGSSLGLLLRVLDLSVIMLTGMGMFWLRHASTHDARTPVYLLGTMFTALSFQIVAEFTHLYRTYRSEPVNREVARIWRTWLVSFTIPLLVAFAIKQTEFYSRLVIGTWIILTPAFLCALRSVIRSILRSLRAVGKNYRRACICGAGEQAKHIAKTVLECPEMGIMLVGAYGDPDGDVPPGTKRAGSVDDMIESARRGELDIIYLTFPLSEMDQIADISHALADSTVSLYVVPGFETFDLFRSPIALVGDVPALSVFETPMEGVDGMIKRLEDAIMGSLLVVLFSIPMLLAAIAVKLTSRGPIFFTQHRYGIDGRKITVYKFRSMIVCEDSPEKIDQAKVNDSRITPVGAFLRKTSLDELPQLINVIQGRMSLVGPRPHAVAHNEAYRKLIHGYMLRHKVKPGMTGLAQIRGWRGETDTLEKMQKRVECDLEYIRNWSLTLDIKILFLTLFVGFRHKNAY